MTGNIVDELIKILTVLAKIKLPYKQYSDMKDYITDVDSNDFDIHDAYTDGARRGEINGKAELAQDLLDTISRMDEAIQSNTDNHPLPEGLYITPDYCGPTSVTRIPYRSEIISKPGEFTVYNDSLGHCGLCGRIDCNGSCFK